MMITIKIKTDRQKNLLIKILRDAREDMKENKEVLERNRHKPNWLQMLNENSFTELALDDLLEQLEQ